MLPSLSPAQGGRTGEICVTCHHFTCQMTVFCHLLIEQVTKISALGGRAGETICQMCHRSSSVICHHMSYVSPVICVTCYVSYVSQAVYSSYDSCHVHFCHLHKEGGHLFMCHVLCVRCHKSCTDVTNIIRKWLNDKFCMCAKYKTKLTKPTNKSEKCHLQTRP